MEEKKIILEQEGNRERELAISAEPVVFGYDEGYEAGGNNALALMWDALQGSGSRVNYTQTAFEKTNFSARTFKPIYDIRPDSAYLMFYQCPASTANIRKYGQVDMVAVEEEQGIVFDFSAVKLFTNAFCTLLFSRLSTIDISNATTLERTFYGGYHYTTSNKDLMCKRIEHLICSETSPFVTNTFQYHNALEYIGFEGVIAKTINLGWSPLIKESILKLFGVLSDTATSVTVTLNLNAVNNAFETSKGALDGSTSEEWLNLVATKPNWTVSLA